uniref:Splicing factor n=1 Tax=Tanacetum cinerariifolium TaxID=118510 RepID=A0A6L2K5A4_TANCI|nr:splicing factor [Tanacetum cinerariifolium]
MDTTRLVVTKNQFLKLPFKENHQAEQGSLYLELMHQQEVVAGVLKVKEVLDVVEIDLEEEIEVEDMYMLIELMDEDEIRVNLEYDYMEDLLDVEEDKRVQEEREYQERLDEEAFQEAMEQQMIYEQMDEERERHNKEEREWEERSYYTNPSNWTEEETMGSTYVQDGDVEVATIAQDKNKGKDIQEGINSQSAAKPVMKSKRLRQEEP